MDAEVEKHGEVLLVHLKGKLDFEAVEYFDKTCEQKWLGRKLVFNLENLNFVGSQGITTFMESVLSLGRQYNGLVKLCNVRTEFRRLFEANQSGEVEIFDTTSGALSAFEGKLTD